jgi:hypothetical protein
MPSNVATGHIPTRKSALQLGQQILRMDGFGENLKFVTLRSRFVQQVGGCGLA